MYTFGQWYSKIDLVYLLRGVNSFENEKWIQEIMFKMAPTPFALKTFIQPKSKMVDRCVCEVKDISSIVDKYKELHLYLY